MTYSLEQMRQLAWIGDAHVQGPIRGVILAFHGLHNCGIKEAPTNEEFTWARAGGLVVFPYYGPWAWMNREARTFIDDLVDSVRREFGVPPEAPLISTGGSMGGQGSLIYTRYSRHRINRALAIAPVCDLARFLADRPDVPRTVAHAFRHYREDFDALVAEHSPIVQAPRLPRIPYMLIHGTLDKSVAKVNHSDPMSVAMKQLGHDVRYLQVDGMGHTGPVWLEITQQQVQFVLDGLGQPA